MQSRDDNIFACFLWEKARGRVRYYMGAGRSARRDAVNHVRRGTEQH